MINNKKSLIFSVFLIISIQTLLLINNKQKTSFRYFIWNVEEVTIGRLLFISFISGLVISSIINKSQYKQIGKFQKNQKEDTREAENNLSNNNEDNNESYEIPPERDLRDTQPTISVNYRIIKDNVENETKERNQRSQNNQYQDDWNNNDSEW